MLNYRHFDMGIENSMSTAAFIGTRATIASKVQGLRKSRHWTQTKLARDLGLSQSRLSEIENGKGSFTAEQFITILRLFNTGLDHFIASDADPGAELQNALARLGATHLRERADVSPSERLQDAGRVITDVVLDPESPRHITALAPVLAQNIDKLSLRRLYAHFVEVGLGHRFAWILDNTREALAQEAARDIGRRWKARYRRAELLLGEFLESLPAVPEDQSDDILDRGVASKKSHLALRESTSPISRRWHIATRI